jgi:hypothetical protein
MLNWRMTLANAESSGPNEFGFVYAGHNGQPSSVGDLLVPPSRINELSNLLPTTTIKCLQQGQYERTSNKRFLVAIASHDLQKIEAILTSTITVTQIRKRRVTCPSP